MSAHIQHSTNPRAIARVKHGAAPTQISYFQELYDKLSYRPPAQRNYFPFVAAGFAVAIVAVICIVVRALV